jgi:hypothetical protein
MNTRKHGGSVLNQVIGNSLKIISQMIQRITLSILDEGCKFSYYY